VSTENLLGPPRWHLLVTPERRLGPLPTETSKPVSRQVLV
jgi:hypothetical protein